MDVRINFPSLGISITPATKKEEIDRLVAKHHQIKKWYNKQTQKDGKEKQNTKESSS